MELSSSEALVFGVSAGFAVLFALVGMYAATVIRSQRQDAAYENQLAELINGESDEDEVMTLEKGRNIPEKWKLYWQNVGKASGIAHYSERNNNAHVEVLYLGGLIAVVVGVLTKNPIIALAAPVLAIYLISVIAKSRYNKQQSQIQNQIPGFLFALKANIQANETPVRAILKVVDNMPEPLRTDLMIVKQKILANSSFAESLQALLEKTTSKELRFLASCLIQASGTGANIEPQINTIQHVLEQRKKADDELQRAIKSTLPAIWISSFVIPGTFIATYFMDPQARAFWFKELLSYVALAMVIGLWGLGMWITRKMVEGIRNL